MAVLKIDEQGKLSHIAPEIYGHFSEHLGRCIYEGLFVGEDSPIPNVNGMRTDVVQALRELKVPVLRWPGGCFADEYHWRDGIGPREGRKRMINTHWGGVVEDNSFGTNEYMELCRQIGCKTYVNGNVGSGTVREMSEWVEYMTFSGQSPLSLERAANGHPEPWALDYFGVGNENWGCGGNMRPEYYANEYRRYQTYIRSYDGSKPIRKICCGPDSADYGWTRTVLEQTFTRCPNGQHGFMDGLSLHYYTIPGDSWAHKGSAVDFDRESWYKTLKKTLFMEELISRHSAIMDEFDPDRQVGLMVDEWGIWCDVEPGTNPGFLYQQSSMRDAVAAAVNLDIFNRHSDRVKMACIAQMVNVLQSVILTEGGRMVKTPTYHVFHMYRHHQDGELLRSTLSGAGSAGTADFPVPKLTRSVSMDRDGIVTVTLANLSADEGETVSVELAGGSWQVAEARILAGASIQSHNTFDEPDAVCERELTDYRPTDRGVELTMPAASVAELRLQARP